ncbi:phosphotransferase enzyme family protein [Cohnella cholangitidis]|uniref:Phosphotransferase n=1 Tax=Cohnella cholangitidis TaxID=2598458 RepID=A0A7G5BUP5_9BACL|nr:phosphotransferase [Cohnella cholangitidis]QMV40679.1 phosphotransferase [Cohnella cholangitidis]
MLKLKYLFDNVDLAEMLLGNWEFDERSVEMFKYYRISSNAIYPFQHRGNTRLLRFAPKTEKKRDQIESELEFISYLRSRGYGVLESVASHRGEKLVEARTPWGEYFASVFKRVSGVQMNKTDFNDDVVFNYGQALGKLHSLSSEYKPTGRKRWSHDEVLNWIREVLSEYPNETAALAETDLLQRYFSLLPIAPYNYGLIHYDFECDNVFYDETSKSCNAIDFDDAMYHWYAMDIEQALESLHDSIPAETYDRKKQCFMDGYVAEFALTDVFIDVLPACRRFANLFGYVRVLRAMAEQWDNEPEWMSRLRERLTSSNENLSYGFGSEI